MNAQGPRRKGRAFEQRIARLIRSRFPGVEVHRSSQADRAYDADLVCAGHPALERLWLELTDGRAPNVKAKLEQAERDVNDRRYVAALYPSRRLPIVIHHRLGERTTYASMRLTTLLLATVGIEGSDDGVNGGDSLVTMGLEDFFEVLP